MIWIAIRDSVPLCWCEDNDEALTEMINHLSRVFCCTEEEVQNMIDHECVIIQGVFKA